MSKTRLVGKISIQIVLCASLLILVNSVWREGINGFFSLSLVNIITFSLIVFTALAGLNQIERFQSRRKEHLEKVSRALWHPSRIMQYLGVLRLSRLLGDRFSVPGFGWLTMNDQSGTYWRGW